MEQVVPEARGCHQRVPQTLSQRSMAPDVVNSGEHGGEHGGKLLQIATDRSENFPSY